MAYAQRLTYSHSDFWSLPAWFWEAISFMFSERERLEKTYKRD